MISVAEALALLFSHSLERSKETVPLAQSVGRVLASEVLADREGPPFHRVAMDGVAISWSDWNAGQRDFPIVGLQTAGQPPVKGRSRTAIEVATGAVLPENCDLVVPYEKLVRQKEAAVLLDGVDWKPWDNVHKKGEDYRTGEILLKAGTPIISPQLHILASVGVSNVEVFSVPRFALAATGDELVEIDQSPRDYQIRRSNTVAIAGEAASWGIAPSQEISIRDDEKSLLESLGGLLKKNDVLIVTGGVSKGRLDLVPSVLERLGVKTVFHEIRQKPGKPLWFGRSADGKAVFGLPGNPVSSLFSFRRYALPYLFNASGLELGETRIRVPELQPGKSGFTTFLAVQKEPNGTFRLSHSKGSGNFHQLATSSGFVQCDPDFDGTKDAEVLFFPWGGFR